MIGPNDVYYGRVWYFRDITAKRRSEQSIRESEEEFRGLVDQSLVGIVLVEDGRFSYVDHNFAAIFGYDIEELTGLGPVDIASDRDRRVIAEALKDEPARAARGHYPVSLVMGDINHFKVINDTYPSRIVPAPGGVGAFDVCSMAYRALGKRSWFSDLRL